MTLLFLILAAAPTPTPGARPLLIVNTSFRPVSSGPSWRLKVRLYPKLSEVYRGADIPTVSGPIVFEVLRPGQKARLTRLEDIEEQGTRTFGVTTDSFVPTFQDLNHDGRADFTLCERTGAYISDCRIFTVREDGSVALLPIFTWSTFRIIQDLEPTCRPLETTDDGFCFPEPGDDNRRRCVRWNAVLGTFQ